MMGGEYGYRNALQHIESRGPRGIMIVLQHSSLNAVKINKYPREGPNSSGIRICPPRFWDIASLGIIERDCRVH